MDHRSKETFSQILEAAAPMNVRELERKALTAGSLAVIYPQDEIVFREVETTALRQIFRILEEQPSCCDPWVGEMLSLTSKQSTRRLAATDSAQTERQMQETSGRNHIRRKV